MDIKVTQILGLYKSRESINTDTYLNLSVNSSERLLPPGEINRVLDLTEQFDYERQSCPYYRISAKISPLISNVLFNTVGTSDCWQIFNDPLFTTSVDLVRDNDYTFAESISKNLKERDGWYGYYNLIINGPSSCNFVDMEPKRDRFSFIPDITNIPNQQVKNWELIITYPYSADTNHYVVNNGLIIVDKFTVVVGGRPMTALAVPVLHNLSEGDNVLVTGTTLDGVYLVKRVGLDDGSLKQNCFCIDVDFNSINITTNSRMRKMYNNVPSDYYFRKFKKIKTKTSNPIEPDDYEIFKLGFSNTIFSDDVVDVVFNEDIDISNLNDNLGRPLSEMYLTIVKTTSNNIFTKVSSGIEVPVLPAQIWNTANINQYLKQIPVIQKIHNVSTWGSQTYTPLESDVKISDNDFYGDIVEYNKTTVIEVILSDIQYRFTTTNRETQGNTTVNGPRPEGYYYKAHHLIRLKTFSSYIEEGDENTVGKPSYSVTLGDGRYYWRDLLNIGTIDISNGAVNYPFLNGAHYLFDNYCFEIKRQDPFDNWDLYFSAFPADPIGKELNKNFKLNQSDNVC